MTAYTQRSRTSSAKHNIVRKEKLSERNRLVLKQIVTSKKRTTAEKVTTELYQHLVSPESIITRDSPFNYLRKHGFIDFNVDTSTPFSCITPIDSFNHVELGEELLTSTPKHSSHPELLRQLALEVINDIPDQALIIYTEGSRSVTGRAGSGIFSNTPGNDVKISVRNPDHCSVFRSELIAISGALDRALNSYKDSIWVLTDSRSSIQYFKNCPKIMDSTGLDISSKLVRLGQRKQLCLQWIQSHVGVPGQRSC
ncbi:RNase H domain-containing protein [Trichonephila clavipes]|uniref:RNase H domain-containing protein n=1 Tax=Trichonephila clavipes TaxID=2585209 RepID=A0A8X6WKS7_TRICX|nr:RNase H domain-containing protein [Trichonephila clavipes]